MREVAIIGVGMTKWGELWEKALRDIYVKTALLAIDDATVGQQPVAALDRCEK